MEKASEGKGYLELQSHLRGGNYTSNLVKSPPISPLCPHGGRWGKTLIGALEFHTKKFILQEFCIILAGRAHR